MSVTPASRPASVTDLDRRVLSAGTTLRFVLLVVLVVVSSMQLIWASAPAPVRGGVHDPEKTCALAAGLNPADQGLPGVVRITETVPEQAYQDCVQRYAYYPWPWVAGGLAAILALTLLIYWLLPRWKTRGGRLVPVLDSELSAELDRLVRDAGLDVAPDFVINPVARTSNAVVFGHWRSRTVSLHAGLVARRRADPVGFRTVVLHELAHIRNGDVGIAYATEALWRVFAVVVLLPYTLLCVYPWTRVSGPGAVVELWRMDWQLGLRGLLKPVLLTALVLLARADVLRTRELYADLDASRWSGVHALPGATSRVRAVRGRVRRSGARPACGVRTRRGPSAPTPCSTRPRCSAYGRRRCS